MATCNKVLDTRNKGAKRFPLKIVLRHKDKSDYINLNYHLLPEEWDSEKQKIKPPYKNSGSANAIVSRKFAIAEEVLVNLDSDLSQLNVAQIKEAIEEKIQEEFQEKARKEVPKLIATVMNSDKSDFPCFFDYAGKVAKKFYLLDKGGSAVTVEEAISSLKSFTGKDKLPFKDITADFMREYEYWYLQRFNQKGKRNTLNGFGFKAKEVRRVFNLAINDKDLSEVTENIYPFGRRGYSIKSEETPKRYIPSSEVAKIYNLKLEPESEHWHHLNFLLYYFECWGMNFMDLAYLRVNQVMGGEVEYSRRKTRWAKKTKKFSIKHTPLAQKIIDYYTKDKGLKDFVFPIIDDIYFLNNSLKDEEKELEAANKKLFIKKLRNKRSRHIEILGELSTMAGLTKVISPYVLRHSFFSIALKNGVDRGRINDMLGHASFDTTEIYLAGFDAEQLEEGADVVRMAVAKHNLAGCDILDEKIRLKTNGKELQVKRFLDRAKKLDAVQMVVKLLSETSCDDGTKAQEFVNAFLERKKSA